jgi:hypothetical protein
MPNACFRCKQSIGSGETFCTSCRHDVGFVVSREPDGEDAAGGESEAESYVDSVGYTKDSRLWLGVAAGAALIALLLVGPVLFAVITGGSFLTTGLLGIGYAVPVAIAFAYALIREYQHITRRDDTEWEPSKWLYTILAAVSILIPVCPVIIGPWHLYKRKQTIGLVLRVSES